MKNPIGWAYEKVDDGIMYGVNKGVRAWNWTTGRGKTDLANKMLSFAPIAETGGAMLSFGNIFGAAMSALCLYDSHIFHSANKEQEAAEQEARKANITLDSSSYDKMNRLNGEISFAIGANFAYISTIDPRATGVIGDSIIASGLAIRGLSHYVMRADEPPYSESQIPKLAKDLKDKLVKKVEDIAPSPLPEPISISIEPRGLEELV